jgi:hypothetical protein
MKIAFFAPVGVRRDHSDEDVAGGDILFDDRPPGIA